MEHGSWHPHNSKENVWLWNLMQHNHWVKMFFHWIEVRWMTAVFRVEVWLIRVPLKVKASKNPTTEEKAKNIATTDGTLMYKTCVLVPLIDFQHPSGTSTLRKRKRDPSLNPWRHRVFTAERLTGGAEAEGGVGAVVGLFSQPFKPVHLRSVCSF